MITDLLIKDLHESYTFKMSAGTTYYILVHDFGTSTGSFNLTLTRVYAIVEDSLDICQGDSIVINRQFESTAGTYPEILSSVIDCDSIVNRTITVNWRCLRFI